MREFDAFRRYADGGAVEVFPRLRAHGHVIPLICAGWKPPDCGCARNRRYGTGSAVVVERASDLGDEAGETG
jgi:hypothetical protein